MDTISANPRASTARESRESSERVADTMCDLAHFESFQFFKQFKLLGIMPLQMVEERFKLRTCISPAGEICATFGQLSDDRIEFAQQLLMVVSPPVDAFAGSRRHIRGFGQRYALLFVSEMRLEVCLELSEPLAHLAKPGLPQVSQLPPPLAPLFDLLPQCLVLLFQFVSDCMDCVHTAPPSQTQSAWRSPGPFARNDCSFALLMLQSGYHSREFRRRANGWGQAAG